MPPNPTPHYGLHAPQPTDSPDVPRDILTLATDVDNALWAQQTARQNADSALTTSINDVKGTGWVAGKTIMDLYTKVPTTRIKYGYSIVDCSASGDGTIVHSAGWLPSHYIACPAFSSTSNPSVSISFDLRLHTTTSIGINVWDVKNNRAYSGSVGVSWTMRD